MNKYKAIALVALSTLCNASDNTSLGAQNPDQTITRKRQSLTITIPEEGNFDDFPIAPRNRDSRNIFGKQYSEPEIASMHRSALRNRPLSPVTQPQFLALDPDFITTPEHSFYADSNESFNGPLLSATRKIISLKPMYEARVLSIDGGGVKALLQLDILARLERKTGRHTTQLFDMIGGTSCGAEIALLLTLKDESTGQPKYSARRIREILLERFPLLFQTKGLVNFGILKEKYKITPIREMLRELAGTAKFGDAVIPTFVTAFNISEGATKYDRLSVLASYAERDLHKSLVDVGLSSLSAPIAFKAHASEDGRTYLDGGLVANNPALIAYSEAKEHFRRAHHITLVSLGAGKFESITNYSGLHTGLVTIAPEIVAMFLEGQQSVTQRTLALMDNVTSYRIDPLVDGEFIPLEDASTETIRRLDIAGNRFWETEQPLIQEIIGRVVRSI